MEVQKETARLAAAQEQQLLQPSMALERALDIDADEVVALPPAAQRRTTKQCDVCSAREGISVPRKKNGCTSTTCRVCAECSRREGMVVLKKVSGCQKNWCQGGQDDYDFSNLEDSEEEEEKEEEEEEEAEEL